MTGCNRLAPCRCTITTNFPGYLYCNSSMARLPPREKSYKTGTSLNYLEKPLKSNSYHSCWPQRSFGANSRKKAGLIDAGLSIA
jgi:hypothetical protein